MNLITKIQNKIYKLLHPPVGEVLMLHRVIPERSRLTANRLLEITPGFLEETIQNYIRKGYDFISVDEMEEIVKKGAKRKRPFVCFTLDDGYADNYDYAYPVFRKYNCPFTIYLTTDFPDGKALLWWYVIEDLIVANNELFLGDGTKYCCGTLIEKNNAFLAIRQKIFDSQSTNMLKVLNTLFAKYNYSFTDKNKFLSLSWNQISELANDELCTIGSHTVTHGVLPNMSDKDVTFELTESKNIIEKNISKQVFHFAYPYGLFSDSVEYQVRSFGYRTALLANGGVVRRGCSIFKIKRNTLIQC